MPAVKGKKALAASKREAVKRGEVVPSAPSLDIDTLSDPTYMPCEEEESDSEPEIVAIAKPQKSTTTREETEPSRTTIWRNATGGTKKARAVKMQRSVASFFQPRVKGAVSPASGIAEKPHEVSDIEVEEIPRPAPLASAELIEGTSEDEDIIMVTQNREVVDVDMAEPTDSSDSTVEIVDSDASSIDARVFEPIPDLGSPDADMGSPDDIDSPGAEDIESGNVSDTGDTSDGDSAPPGLHGGYASDEQARSFTRKDPKVVHQKLRRLIETLRKNYKQKKTVLTNDNAASRLIDLEALDQYNDERFKLQMQIETLKLRAKSTPYRVAKQRFLAQAGRIRPATQASLSVARRVGKGPHYARILSKMAKEVLLTGALPESRRGKGAFHHSHLLNPKVSSALQAWVKGGLDYEHGGFNGPIAPTKLRRYVNEFLFPQLSIEDTISESTAVAWLKKLGYSVSRVQKGVYVDGHERPDVVEARNAFINYIYSQVLPYAYSYEGNDVVEVPPLSKDQKIHYPIFHDETCIHANDLANYVWMREGEQPLRSKSRGRIIHVSDFIIEASGRLNLTAAEIAEQMKLPERPQPPSNNPAPPNPEAGSGKQKRKTKKKTASSSKTSGTSGGRSLAAHDEEWTPPPPPAPFSSYRLSSFDARRIIYPGANHDPWWDMPQLIAQTKDAIDIFNVKYPDGVAVFIFDCSSAHEAFASDALIAHKMNRHPGGKQPVMHDTVIPSTGERQSMVFPMDYDGVGSDGEPLAGRPKGMEQILRERNLLSVLDKTGRGYVAVCGECKMSQAARDAAAKEARAKQDEIEGSGIAGMTARGVSEMDDADQSRSKTCCMQRVLSLQQDFLEEKPLLQLIVERAGHKCLFLPKFHCELNPIEMVWGQTKQKFRGLADGTFKKAKELVPECLDAVTTQNIRRYFQHCWRYMSAYKLGLNLKQAAYAVKKYTSHRRVPNSIVMDVNVLLRGQTG